MSSVSRRTLLGAPFLPAFALAARQPNILMILMDDLGYPTLGCYGNRYVPTPNLDRLASQGMRFTQAYVTPQCTPTRATILTGQYTARNKMWHVIPYYGFPRGRVIEPPYRENLPRNAFTLGKGLQAAGYRTALIGKWHLTRNEDGDYNSLRQEAAAHYGFDVTAKPLLHREETRTGDKAVNRLTDESIAFFENQRQPWCCLLTHHTVHRALSAPDALVAKYRAKGYPESGFNSAVYLACLEHLDQSVGRLLGALERSGQAANTMVLFLSDNGGIRNAYLRPKPRASETEPLLAEPSLPEFQNDPLRAGKGYAYEGGIRTPLIVRWPGRVQPGSECRVPVHAVDLLPTLLQVAGGSAPTGYSLDGLDLGPALSGGRLPDRPLFWYMPFYDTNWLATPSAAIRDQGYKLVWYFGDWFEETEGAAAKYHVGERLELYHLDRDPGEKTDLAARQPARVRRMRDQLRAWIEQTGNVIPGLNPNYDPLNPFQRADTRPSGWPAFV